MHSDESYVHLFEAYFQGWVDRGRYSDDWPEDALRAQARSDFNLWFPIRSFGPTPLGPKVSE